MENYNWESGDSTEKWVVEMKIKQIEKAIENLGKDFMQTMMVSGGDDRLNVEMRGGSYIDLSDNPIILHAMKDALLIMLEIQKDILKNI